jgi:hypothetical protein
VRRSVWAKQQAARREKACPEWAWQHSLTAGCRLYPVVDQQLNRRGE